MSELKQAFGVGTTFVWKGVRYHVAVYSWKLRGLFQEWLEACAFAKVQKRRGKIDPILYREQLEVMGGLVGGKSFEAGNAAFLEAAKSLEGQAYETYLRMLYEADAKTTKQPQWVEANGHQGPPPAITYEVAEEIVASEAWDELVLKMQMVDADPNAPKEASKESPSPGGQ